MAAPAKAGKSWIGYEIALSLATGRPCFNKFPPTYKTHVLVLALEESKPNLKQRLHMMTERRKELKHIDFRFEWPKGTKAIEQLEDYLDEHPETKLVIIDPLFAIRKGKNKSEDIVQEDYGMIAKFRKLADQYKISILIIHHTSKLKTENSFEKISGTGGLTAATHHNMIYDGKPMTNGGTIQVVGKTGLSAMFAVERREEDGKLRPLWIEAKEYALKGNKKKIFDELKDHGPEEWLLPRDLAELCEIKPTPARKALWSLKLEDIVETCKTGPKDRYYKYRLVLSHRKDLEDYAEEVYKKQDSL
jgi:hypothetical protein